MQPPLEQYAGYCVVLIMGLGFSALMLAIGYFQKRYGNKVESAEEFNSASRSVRTGLISSGVVSAWCWSATLL